MNEDTRIAVCCYAGDQHQVIKALGHYLHHQRPVVVLSPEDSRAEIRYPGIENRFGGARAHVGQVSLDRQRLHLQMLLGFPENFFLVHDADSVCLSPELPRYLYEPEEMLWANLVIDPIPEHAPTYPEGMPHVALQPPYFFNRRTLKRLLSGVGDVVANPMMPFIDHYMLQLATKTGCPYHGFLDGISCPIDTNREDFHLIRQAIRQGTVMVHSVKQIEALEVLKQDREEFLRTQIR